MWISERRAFRNGNMGKGSTVGIRLVLSGNSKASVAGTHDARGQAVSQEAIVGAD